VHWPWVYRWYTITRQPTDRANARLSVTVRDSFIDALLRTPGLDARRSHADNGR
jgi:hypothetical protein